MKYECNGRSYEANSTHEAYYLALVDYGIEAIGKCVKGERNDFLCGVCLEAFRSYFPTFADADFLEYELASNKAWAYGEVTAHQQWEDGEKVTVYRLSDADKATIDSTRLGAYMQATRFVW